MHRRLNSDDSDDDEYRDGNDHDVGGTGGTSSSSPVVTGGGHASSMGTAGDAQAMLIQRLEQIAQTLPSTFPAPPDTLQRQLLAPGVVMRPYQTDGVAWLLWMHQQDLSGILADEMGLGKTLQAIAFVALFNHMASSSTLQHHPALILVPLSILEAWIDEFRKFAPSLSVARLWGNQQERNEQKGAILAGLRRTGGSSSQHPHGWDAVVTTYETAVSEVDFLKSLPWGILVVDEAHRLKNPSSLLHQRLLSLNCQRKLLMTGTPVQNNLTELQALLSFANPSVFDSQRCDLQAWFGGTDTPSSKTSHSSSRMDTLTKLLRPLILRRIKEDVVQLPPIKEVVVHAPLSAIQRRLYLSILTRDWSVFDTRRPKALRNILIQLRKCVAHPYLFDGVEPEPFVSGEHLVESSGKLIVLDRLLKRAHGQGKRVLVFSQMTHLLDIVQDYLTMRRFSYERLDGSVRGEERHLAVRGFQGTSTSGEQGAFVFLLSTRAGGVGLNLTAADMAIFLDMDFNPAIDAQAAARLHRIGQTKSTTLIRIVCPHTVDDVVWRRARRKLALQKEIMTKGVLRAISAATTHVSHDDDKCGDHAHLSSASDATANWSPKEPDELIAMLQFGIDRIVQDEKNSTSNGDNANPSVNRILPENVLSDEDLDAIFDPGYKYAAGVDDNSDMASKRNDSIDTDIDRECVDHIPSSDSIYIYLGQDYHAAADAINRLRIEQDHLQGSSAAGGSAASSRKRRFGDEDDEEYAQTIADRVVQAEQRRIQLRAEKWASHGYVSYVIDADGVFESMDGHALVTSTQADAARPMDGTAPASPKPNDSSEIEHDESDKLDDHTRLRLWFASGNAAQPQTPINDPAIIVHVVDDSGSWPNLGFFQSIASLYAKVPQYYTTSASKAIKNLRFGTVHLIPVSTQPAPSSSSQHTLDLYVALIVAQRASARDRIDFAALTTGLDRVACAAERIHASVHMPRLGQNLPSMDWYAVERIIDKALPRQGVPTTIYYYKRYIQ